MKWKYQIIMRYIAIVLFTSLSFSLVSCSDGSVGPSGPDGDKGTKGDTGDAGAEGRGILSKSGSFTGTITGTRSDNTPISETFTYAYTNNGYDVIYNDGDDYLDLRRYRDAYFSGEGTPSIDMRFQVTGKGTAQEALTPYYMNFGFIKILSDPTKVFYVNAGYNANQGEGSATLTITNFSHDQTTGILKFDYTYIDNYNNGGPNNTTSHPLTITGSFNSGTDKVYNTVVNRKGS